LIDCVEGHYSVMTGTTDEPPNLRPGPTEQGGHGDMATREQEARIYEEQQDTEASD
jgi:hypothetical protein